MFDHARYYSSRAAGCCQHGLSAVTKVCNTVVRRDYILYLLYLGRSLFQSTIAISVASNRSIMHVSICISLPVSSIPGIWARSRADNLQLDFESVVGLESEDSIIWRYMTPFRLKISVEIAN
jgi:hypothetical protein